MLAKLNAWFAARVFRKHAYHEKFVILNFIDFYYNSDHENIFGLSLDSGDDHDYPGNKIILSIWKYSIYIKIPKVLSVHRQMQTFTHLSEEAAAKRIAQHGHLNYFELFPRVFGFRVKRHGVNWNWGPQTNDSITSKSGYASFPWMDYDFQRKTAYGADGHAYEEPKGFQPGSRWDESFPRYVFVLNDYDGEEIRAYCYLEKTEYRIGSGWMKKYFSALRPRRTFRDLEIRFDGETGTEKGSWKGGTVGTSVRMEKGDKFDAQYLIEKFCQQDHRAKGARYKMTLIGREPDAPFTHDTYRKASEARKAKKAQAASA